VSDALSVDPPAIDPNVAQRMAAHGGTSVWVAASAGTGKTKVLTDRVLALMLGGSEPQRILCLTFTKAAAAEMANRLNKVLSEWTVMGDGALAQRLVALTGDMPDGDTLNRARRLFAQVLDAPGGMKIETLHAFCQSLLRRFPLEAGIAPHFEVMDERTAEDALAAARDEVLAAARTGRGPTLAEALALVTDYAAETVFDELIGELVLERARLARALRDGHDAFLARLHDLAGIALGTSAAAALDAACAEGAGDEGALRAAATAMLASGSKRDGERGTVIAAWLAEPATRAANFDLYLDVFFTREGDRRKDIATKAVAANHPCLGEEAERLGAVKRQRAAAALVAATAALCTLGGALLDAYEAHKRARALLDYDDLVLGARDLLQQEGVAPWVLFKLDGGLDHILIDEAQDTNPEQWEIVRALADEFFSGLGASERTRTVFAVGDGKQSIYSFQRADPHAFLRMRDHFARQVKAAEARWQVIPLDVSFRSTAPVLAAVDAVFARPEANDGVLLDAPAIRHRAFRAGQGGLVELWPPVAPEAAPDPAPWEPPLAQSRTREPPARLAAAIAATVRRWLDGNERLPSGDRRVRPGDVMVLVRRRGPFVTELVRALKNAGVDVAGADRMRLTDQLAVQDLLALAQFLLLPEDDLTLATVLKSPLFGVGEDELFTLAFDRGERTLWSALRRRAGEAPSFARAAEELGALLARVDYRPPFELFVEVLGARGGRRALLARLGAEAADPLDELLSAALAYERTHGPSLQGFLHWLAAGDIEIKRDVDQRGRDEARILTVHGAKGLQAPIVFLPDTMQVPNRVPRIAWCEDGTPLWRAGGDCGAAALDRARAAAVARRDEEYRRLLYVALTRAEDRLYVCGWQTRKTPPAGNWHALVAAGLQDAPGAAPFDFDTAPLIGSDGWSGTGWRLAAAQTAVPTGKDKSTAPPLERAPLPGWASRSPAPEPSPPRPLAPSAPVAEPAVRSPAGADDGAGFLRGRLVHRLLQTLPELAPPRRAEAAERFLARPVHGLDAAAQRAIRDETLAVLDHPAFAPIFGPGSQAEVPVVGLIGGRALAGQIDRLVVTGDEVLIVDYKTLRPPPLSEAQVPDVYLRQLAAYRAAVAAIYPRHRIRCALLWTDGPRLMPIGDSRLALGNPD
jgi:ATP-dependent helicase/nuclease subunit A